MTLCTLLRHDFSHRVSCNGYLCLIMCVHGSHIFKFSSGWAYYDCNSVYVCVCVCVSHWAVRQLLDSSAYIYIYIYICVCVCVTECAWGHHFPPLSWGSVRTFALAFCSEQLPTLRWPGACADFPAKSNRMTSSEHHLVTSQWCGGFWMLTFTSQVTSGLRGIKDECQGKGVPSS